VIEGVHPQSAERIPLADAAGLRRELRRTRVTQLALAAALVGLLAGALVVAARADDRPARFLPPGASGIIVVDVSSSIRPQGYGHIARTLREGAASGERYGLVLFSDTAYEALPPGTRSAELRPFARLFAEDAAPGAGPGALGGGPFGRPNPWRAHFTGGTRVSSGLQLARTMLERDGIEDGAVLLISDLATDTSDLPKLSRTLIDYERAGVPLKVASLGPLPDDVAFFERMLRDPSAVIERPRLRRSARTREAEGDDTGFPVWMVALGAALLGVLALNELWCGRLRWRAAP
jgi:hypothetical protein